MTIKSILRRSFVNPFSKIFISLASLVEADVTVWCDGQWGQISSTELKPGDKILLEAGTKIPSNVKLAGDICRAVGLYSSCFILIIEKKTSFYYYMSL